METPASERFYGTNSPMTYELAAAVERDVIVLAELASGEVVFSFTFPDLPVFDAPPADGTIVSYKLTPIHGRRPTSSPLVYLSQRSLDRDQPEWVMVEEEDGTREYHVKGCYSSVYVERRPNGQHIIETSGQVKGSLVKGCYLWLETPGGKPIYFTMPIGRMWHISDPAWV